MSARKFWIQYVDPDKHAEGGYWKVFGPGVWLDSLPKEFLSKFIHVREVTPQDQAYRECFEEITSALKDVTKRLSELSSNWETVEDFEREIGIYEKLIAKAEALNS